VFDYPYFLEDEDEDEDVPATAPSLTVIPGGGDSDAGAEVAQPALTVVGDAPATTLGMRLHYKECANVRTAALKARRLWPGPVGELVFRELTAYANFGFRFERTGLTEQLLQHVLDAELDPNPPAPAAAAAA
jgi:hypothetical protein